MLESLYFSIQGEFLSIIKPVLLITIPVYVIYFFIDKLLNKNKTKKRYMYFVEFCFIAYIVSVLVLTEVLSVNLTDFTSLKMAPNLIPLIQTIKDFIYYPYGVVEQILLNVALFIPFGVFYMIICNKEKKILKASITALIFSFSIEVLEYFTGRYFDIDDIIWNTIGALVGILLYTFIKKILELKKKDKITTNKINFR